MRVKAVSSEELVQELEKLPRITRMPEMKLKKQSDDSGVMQADMVLSIFFEGATRQASANAG